MSATLTACWLLTALVVPQMCLKSADLTGSPRTADARPRSGPGNRAPAFRMTLISKDKLLQMRQSTQAGFVTIGSNLIRSQNVFVLFVRLRQSENSPVVHLAEK